ncbi:MAG: hypothetical protein R3E08_04515 [Thiotrichaceae bacterium]
MKFAPADFMELLKLMAQSKLVLNCRSNTQGMTERAPSTMLNGAVSINDTNNYQYKNLSTVKKRFFMIIKRRIAR